MSEKSYRLKITNNSSSETDENWSCDGFVGQSVIDKIRSDQFVEFNLLLGYSKEGEDEDTAYYRRYHYSPVKDMEVEIQEVSPEEMISTYYNEGKNA